MMLIFLSYEVQQVFPGLSFSGGSHNFLYAGHPAVIVKCLENKLSLWWIRMFCDFNQ